jgi:hypothetical protein
MSEAPPAAVAFPGAALTRAGLNRHAVFDLARLAPAIRATLGAEADPAAGFRQLILIGHGGQALWAAIRQAGREGPDPIDDYTRQTVVDWFANALPGRRYRIVYPGPQPVALQQLGQLAGWHHATPFMLDIDGTWGTWWAYRAAVLANSNFVPFPAVDRASEDKHPCAPCTAKPCLSACPAGALAGGRFALAKCVAYRRQPDSACAYTCLARLACPVGSAHRYEPAQLRHSYAISLQTIRDHY